MKKEWLTPQEIAHQTGYTRQTINEWINREKWVTAARKGVQGGRGRKVLIDDRVRQFLQTSSRQVSEDSGSYNTNWRTDPLANLLITSVQQMTSEERAKLSAFLHREGFLGMLKCLGIVQNCSE